MQTRMIVAIAGVALALAAISRGHSCTGPITHLLQNSISTVR